MNSDLAWFARSMLSARDWGFALRLEAHFDESGTHAQEITLAGYLFEAARMERFCDEWSALLKQYGVPFFHMVECAHNVGSCSHLEKSECLQLQMSLMRLIKIYAVNGIVCNIENVLDNMSGSYQAVVARALDAVAEWANRTGFDGRIGYFLEAGANGQGLVEADFGNIARDPARAASHKYAGHSFVPKLENPGVQAADLLAWQYHNFTMKREKQSPARLDLRALLRHPHLLNDECGEPPREPAVQTVQESRGRLETIFYLPTVSAEEALQRLIFAPMDDITLFKSEGWRGRIILACPTCFRGLAELYELRSMKNIVFKCWCGTYCDTPAVRPPFASPQSLKRISLYK